MRYRAAVALGSNLGDRETILRTAVGALSRLGDLVTISPLYETAPVGGPDQGPFLNAVAIVDTSHPPAELLEMLHNLETEAGRERGERWGPRILDLDLVTVVDGDGVMQTAVTRDLTLPHPRAIDRRFVLEPLTEVWPGAPLGQSSAGTALTRVMDQDVVLTRRRWVGGAGRRSRLLLGAQVLLGAVYGLVLLLTGRSPTSPLPVVLGGALLLVGSGLAIVASVTLGGAFSPFPEPVPGAPLAEIGPYRWVRHPIYTGGIVALLGGAIFLASWEAAATTAVVVFFLARKARYEEERLLLTGGGYRAYMTRVGGRFFPRPPA